MKRGLVVLDPSETPPQEWNDRLARVQHSLTDLGVDVALLYGDVSRSDDIAYLTNLCIYWNEGVLAVPRHGPATFLTKLSLRVQNWMKRSSTVEEFRGGPNFAELVAHYLSDRGGGTLGLVDAALWPAAVVEEITAAVPGWRVRRLEGLVRKQRLVPSATEHTLLREAGGILHDTVETAILEGLTAGQRVEIVERTLRGAGFLDVYPSSLSASDEVRSFGVTAQYRTGWVHTSRILGHGGGWSGALRTALTAALTAAQPGAAVSDLALAAHPALAALPRGASSAVRWINQADLSTAGEFGAALPDVGLAAGEVGAVSIEVAFADGGHAAVAETVRVNGEQFECLTGAQQ